VQRRRDFGRGAWWSPKGALILAQVAALAGASTAGAQERRVAALDADAPLTRALTVALSPWQLGVVPTPGPAPAPDFDTASARARVIALDQHADVVVWLVPPARPGEPGSLWVYDTASQQLVVRPLIVSPPFDAAAAAAVALSVKTILRGSPLVSQFAEEAAPATTTAPPLVPPAATAVPQETTDRPAESSSDAPPAPWRFETLVGARTPTGAGAAAEPWAELGLSLWPRAQGGHFGWGIGLQGGSGVSLASGAFDGSYRQGALDVTARLRTSATRWLSFELRAGPEIALTSFTGQATGAASIHALRVNPALDVGGIVDFAPWARVHLGLVGDAVLLLRFQRYALDGLEVLDEPPVALVLGVRLSVEVD